MRRPARQPSSRDRYRVSQSVGPKLSRGPGLLYDLVLPLFAIRGRLIECMEDECARRGLTCTEAVALLHLSVRKLTVSEVSRAAGLQRSGGSVLVDRLHERKLVRRLPDTEDRRVMAVELTAAGRRLVTTLSRRLASQTRDLLAPVPVSQREHVISGLRILADLRE